MMGVSGLWAAYMRLPAGLVSVINGVVGMLILLFFWWLGGLAIAANPNTQAFAAFAPASALSALYELILSGTLWSTISSSLYRILSGLFLGIIIGIPIGVMLGY